MLKVNDSIINAYNQYTTQRKSYIQVGKNFFFVQNLDVQADSYDEGNVIGNAIAKIAKFDIETEHINQLDEFELFDGIWTGNQYEYVSLGTFKLFEEQGTDDFFSSVTAYDKLINFNVEYNPSTISFPISLYNFLVEISRQAGVELSNASIPNGNQMLQSNLFVEGETLKQILKAICQINGCIGIISQDKLKLLLKGTETLNLSKYQISNPEYKRNTWAINQVVLGMSDVDGEYVLRQNAEDIQKNGVHKLVINDNPFVYTQALREQYIDNLFNQVKGFGYTAFETKWEGLPYVELGDLVNIDGRESIILRYNLKSPNGLESTLSAPSIIDSVIDYVDNANSIENRQKRTEYSVDKANQKIKLLSSETEEATKTLVTSKTAKSEKKSIYIEDAGEYNLKSLIIDGKSEQETRSGKNLLKGNLSSLAGFSNGVTASYDSINSNEVTLSGTSTGTWANISGTMPDVLPPGTYTLSIDKPIPYGLNIKGSYEDGTIFENGIAIGSTSKTFTITKSVLRRYIFVHSFATGTNVSVKFKFQLEKGSTATEIEEYGASPSPEYPSEIKSVGYTNLFDKENITLDYRLGSDGLPFADKNYFLSDFISVDSLSKYTYMRIGKNVSEGICYYDENKNFILRISDMSTSSVYTFETTNTTKYVRIADSVDSLDIACIYKGSIAHNYIPYNKYGIDVNVTGKNLFDYVNNFRSSINGLTNTINPDGSITITGKPTVSYTAIVTRHSIDDILENDQIYTMSSRVTDGSVYMEIRAQRKSDGTYQYINGNKTFTSNLEEFTYTITAITVPVERWGTESKTITAYWQLEKGNKATEFKPHRSSVTQLILNEPLRSLPNGIKDETYIENGKLYVKRKVGRVVLDGSEDWARDGLQTGCSLYSFFTRRVSDLIKNESVCMSNNLAYTSNNYSADNIGIFVNWQGAIRIKIGSEITTLDEFKTWLSKNNVEVLYELAEPIIEEIGNISISTFEGINNIYLISKLDTNYELTYLTDSDLNGLYTTKTELNIAKNEITSNVSATFSTKKETQDAKNEAIKSSNDTTDEKLIEMNNTISQKITDKTNEINLSVENKLSEVSDNDGNVTSASILLAINDDESEATIKSDKISLEGLVTANENFEILEDGSVEITNGKIDLKGVNIPSEQSEVVFKVSSNDLGENSSWVEVAPSRINFNSIENKSENTLIQLATTSVHDYDRPNNKSGSLDIAETDLRYWTHMDSNRMYILDSSTGNTTDITSTKIITPILTQTSLETQKKNFKKLENGLEIIKNTDIYKYNLKHEDDNSKPHIGFVIGNNFNYSSEITSIDNEGKEIGVDLYSMVSVCLQAIQTQQTTIEELQEEIKNLKGE